MEGAQCITKFDKCFDEGGCWSIFDCVGRHQCFESDAGSYEKPVAGAQECVGVGELGKVLGKSYSCILVKWHTGTDLPILLSSSY